MNINAFSNDFLKPIVCGVGAAAIEKYFYNASFGSSAVFGASVGVGIASVSWVEPLLKSQFQSTDPYTNLSGGFMARILEISAGAGVAYQISQYSAKATGVYVNSDDIQRKLIIIAISDVVSESLMKTIRPQY